MLNYSKDGIRDSLVTKNSVPKPISSSISNKAMTDSWNVSSYTIIHQNKFENTLLAMVIIFL